MKHTLTEEQRSIIEAPFKSGELVKVIAFAGTGKTSTLVELAQRLGESHSEWKILYLAFNKSLQNEAAGKFPSNTTCKTTHALAYARFGAAYRHKLSGNLRIPDVVEALGLSRKDFLLVRYSIDTLQNWLNSAQRFIQNLHCPGIELNHQGFIHKVEVVEWAKRIWKMMKDEKDPSVAMIHDGYLKLFQLEGEALPWDVVFFDECQDANPVTTDIVLKQDQALRVLVGDSHQQIYAFRGAVNAIDTVRADHLFYLTGSFRFGDEFANLANILLSEYKGEKQDLHGLGGIGHLTKIEASVPHAVLSRTNAGLFDEAVADSGGRKLGFLGGIENYRFSTIEDVFHLSRGMKARVRSKYLQRFDDLEDLNDMATDLEDVEMLSVLKIVERYGKDIPALLKDVSHRTCPRVQSADVLLATTHKAKGFEFRRVKLLDDFTDFFEEKNRRRMPESFARDEINLYYVAVTRAKEELHLNRKLKRIISYLAKKYEEYPLISL